MSAARRRRAGGVRRERAPGRHGATHVGLGVIAGTVLIAMAAIAVQHTEEFAGIQPRGLTVGETGMLVGYAILTLGVCALACIVPALRALRVQPMEALRAEIGQGEREALKASSKGVL